MHHSNMNLSVVPLSYKMTNVSGFLSLCLCCCIWPHAFIHASGKIDQRSTISPIKVISCDVDLLAQTVLGISSLPHTEISQAAVPAFQTGYSMALQVSRPTSIPHLLGGYVLIHFIMTVMDCKYNRDLFTFVSSSQRRLPSRKHSVAG